jgi:hypothetical protein
MMRRIEPLAVGAVPELKAHFDAITQSGHYIPNSQLIMQRRPKMVRAISALAQAVFDPEGEVSVGFKRLLGFVVSRSVGCHY